MSVRPSIIIPNMPMPKLSRRSLLKFIAAAAPSAAIPKALLSQGASPHHIAPGPFQPSWDSLTAGYQTPDWHLVLLGAGVDAGARRLVHP